MDRRLAIFDIDGTLIVGDDGTFEPSLKISIKEVFGIDVDPYATVKHGTTDTADILNLLKINGIKSEEANSKLNEIFRIILDYRTKHLDSSKFKIIPGVMPLLDELKSKGYILGLTTGNMGEVARMKLEAVKLYEYFEFGGFGEVSEIRAKVLEYAIKDAEQKFRKKFDNGQISYLGDTPYDIECGKAIGIKTIAVATGHYSYEELSSHKPEYIFKDFLDKDIVMRSIERNDRH